MINVLVWHVLHITFKDGTSKTVHTSLARSIADTLKNNGLDRDAIKDIEFETKTSATQDIHYPDGSIGQMEIDTTDSMYDE